MGHQYHTSFSEDSGITSGEGVNMVKEIEMLDNYRRSIFCIEPGCWTYDPTVGQDAQGLCKLKPDKSLSMERGAEDMVKPPFQELLAAWRRRVSFL